MAASSGSMWAKSSMRTRLVGAVVVATTGIIALLGTYFIVSQRDMMLEQRDAERKRMYDELGEKGLALASNVALASERALVVKDFLFLTQIVASTQSIVPDCAFGSLMDVSGRARVHTNQALASTTLSEPDDLAARQTTTASVRMATYQGRPVMEAIAPVKMGDERWGVARFGFYLNSLNAEVARREQAMAERIKGTIVTTLTVLGLVIAVGIVLGSMGARALTRPLGTLLTAVQALREGSRDQAVNVLGSPEIVALAEGFNDMSRAVQNREHDLRKALAIADEASRLKSEFLANISHELRTPLNAIVNVPKALLGDFKATLVWSCPGCSKMFEPDEGDLMEDGRQSCPSCSTPLKVTQETLFVGVAETHRHFNQRALSSAQHLLRVVNDLLDFSRLQAHKAELVLDDVLVNDFVGDVKETMQSLAEAKHIDLRFDVQAGDALVRLDRVKMGQVLINLIGNSIKFTPENGSVVLTMENGYEGNAELLHFAVRDTGIGVPQNQLQSIFEPFRQVDGSHTRSFGGSGLGLTITAQLVQLHGGRIWAESEEGKGSTFHVLMPRRPPVPEAELPLHETGQLLLQEGVRRVVILDDDDTYLRLCRHMLEKAGFEVVTLSDPAKALTTVQDMKPDIFITDIMMPHLSGIDIVRKLRATDAGRDLRVIVSTAYGANKDVVMQLGVMWLPKPWTADQLVAYLLSQNLALPAQAARPAQVART